MNNKTFIIAEIGVNHNGSIDLAKEMIDAAKECGVDAVKFQSYKTELLVTKTAARAEYQERNLAEQGSQFEMLKQLELSEADHYELFDYCKVRKLQFLSTPFDFQSADLLLNQLDLPVIKISSGDLTNAPLLLKIAKSQAKIILSTGMANLEEIEAAVSVLAYGYFFPDETPSREDFLAIQSNDQAYQLLREKLTLLQCTTEYPAPLAEVNLRTMQSMRDRFLVPVGFSDHTEGTLAAIAAVGAGARVVEKHFTLDKNAKGPDHKASIEPKELKEMVQSIRTVELVLGSGQKKLTVSEAKNADVARKSIVAASVITKGELFTEANLFIKRPGNGISPLYYWDIIGQRATRDYQADELIVLE